MSNPSTAPKASHEELVKTLNFAILSTRADTQADQSRDLMSLMSSPGFQSILNCVRQLATSQGISEQDAAIEIIRSFRKLDAVWLEFLCKEGFERVKSSLKS